MGEAAKIVVGLVMGIVMMGTIMLIATMMVEIAVDLMSKQPTALNVNALKLAAKIVVGLMMGIVMMGTIMLIATMMVEIAVDLMSIRLTALNVNALKLTIVPHHMMQEHKASSPNPKVRGHVDHVQLLLLWQQLRHVWLKLAHP